MRLCVGTVRYVEKAAGFWRIESFLDWKGLIFWNRNLHFDVCEESRPTHWF
jgi:hypothetical protein